MKKSRIYLFALLSGILFSLAWPTVGFPVLLFISFIPLLYIEDAISENKDSGRWTLFLSSFLAFLIWNITSTFWVCNASVPGGIAAILLNTLIMAVVFVLFHVAKTKLIRIGVPAARTAYLLPVFWIGYEFFHHRWDVSWPWLALGNAWAANPTWIQWYEYTGVPGGSLWVLVVNLLIYSFLKKKEERRKQIIQLSTIAGIIIFPILISEYIYASYNPAKDVASKKKINVVVVQPNIDPFSEKFKGMNYKEQLDKMLALAKEKTDSATDYLVFPETSLTEDMWENELSQASSIQIIKFFLKNYPKLKVVVGAATTYMYEKGETPSVTARKFLQQDGYYDAYNTALQIDNSDSIQIYHKSKLVPGVERMPYPAVFGFLGKMSVDLGGMSGSLGTQDERSLLTSDAASVAPTICYESIYGEYVTDYIKKGASVLFIITNDGWWRDTPGYKQHLIYGRLRAIETRRCIARSANTGISCFINERGDFSQETNWWVPAVIKESINLNTGETFYVRHGEIIGRVCFYSWLLILLMLMLLRFIKR